MLQNTVCPDPTIGCAGKRSGFRTASASCRVLHRLVRSAWLLTAVVIAASCSTPTRPTDFEGVRARNIVFIMGDDHSAEVLGAYGNARVRTPHLDAFSKQGMLFTRAYANSPVCTPSRQSILTGRLPHATGVTLLRTPLPEEAVTLADHLLEAGFRTGAIGKMHFNSDLHHGFETRIDTKEHLEWVESNRHRQVPAEIDVRPPWKPFQDPARIWLNADTLPGAYYDVDSEGTYFAEKAVEFLQANRNDRLCLWVSFREPHSPFNFPIEYAGSYSPSSLPLPAAGPEDHPWIPEVFRDLTEEEKRGIVAAYYTSVEYLDKNVGRVLDGIEELGLSDETLVIYVGDQGYLLGHHGRFEKHTMWEPAVRAPLLIRSPGLKPGRTEALVEFVDLLPTILEVLEIPPIRKAQGESLIPVLEDPGRSHRDFVFSEFLPDNMAMVRTDEWKYVFTSGKRDLAMGYATGNPPPGITHRLYQVRQDPEELTNLARRAEYREVLEQLKGKMLERFLKTHPKADALPAGLSIDEALEWFCEPPEE